MRNERTETLMVRRLSKIAVGFYVSVFVGAILHVDQAVLDALESAGTLSLGAFIGIIQESKKKDC